jgi:hypothetical protein
MFNTNRAPILHRHKHYLQLDQNKIPHDPRHLGVPSGASKMISEAGERLAQTVHLSCVKICSISKWTESSIHLSLVTQEYHQVRPKSFLSLWYVRHKPCTYLASRLALYQINWIKHPLELRHLGVLSGVSKIISEPTVCLAQTVHVSCTDTNTISKWTKTRFHMTHVTLEFHSVRPKWFLRLWYVPHKPCTYLASRLALYQINWIKLPLEPQNLGVLSGASKIISEPMEGSMQTVHPCCVKISTITKRTKSSIHLSLVT